MANNRKPFYEQGAYIGRVTSQALTESKTGTVQFVIRFKVIAYPDDSTKERVDIDSAKQFERTLYMPLTDKTMEYQVENLQRLGFEGDDLAYLDPNVEGFHDFKDDEINVYCKHEEYNGAMQERWQVSSPREVIVRDVDPRALRNLNTLFGKAKRASGAASKGGSVGKSPANSAATYSDQEITDEDIPF